MFPDGRPSGTSGAATTIPLMREVTKTRDVEAGSTQSNISTWPPHWTLQWPPTRRSSGPPTTKARQNQQIVGRGKADVKETTGDAPVGPPLDAPVAPVFGCPIWSFDGPVWFS